MLLLFSSYFLIKFAKAFEHLHKPSSGKKSKSVFLTYLREIGFLFSYAVVFELIGLITPSNKIDRINRFDNSLSFGAKQNVLRQIFFVL